jgi:DNA (cytosine-5)-methyltransferase 1
VSQVSRHQILAGEGMNNVAPFSIIEACAGVGMLGRAVSIALEFLGIDSEVVCCVELEAGAAGALMASMEAEGRRIPPIWDDARTFCGRRERGLGSVDVFIAGYPCPDYSHAGKRAGNAGARYVWPSIRRIIARRRPGIVFLENVDGHISLGAGKVIRDLQRLGYAVTCGCFSAEEVGAPHQRKRLFIMAISRCAGIQFSEATRPDGAGAYADGAGTTMGNSERERLDPAHVSKRQRRSDKSSANAAGTCAPLGDPEHGDAGQREMQRESNGDGRATNGRSRELADSASGGFGASGEPSRGDGQLNGSDEQLADAPIRWEGAADGSKSRNNGPRINGQCRRKIFPPGRTDYRRWAEFIAGGLDPSNMPAIESGVSVLADGMASSADLLRFGGNGVVPLCAAYAFLHLLAALMEPVATEKSVGALFAPYM